MNTTFAGALAIAWAAASFDAAADELVRLDWAADGSFAKDMAVPPGKFVEACGRLPAKAAVAWDFDAGVPMDFNVHYHAGKKVLFPAQRRNVAKASGTLNTKVEQDYCWMWTNKTGAEANLRFSLSRR